MGNFDFPKVWWGGGQYRLVRGNCPLAPMVATALFINIIGMHIQHDFLIIKFWKIISIDFKIKNFPEVVNYKILNLITRFIKLDSFR